jgi:hypothetical protein
MLGNWHVHFSPDVIQMKGGGFMEGIYIVLFIVAVGGALVLGGWLAIKYIKPEKTPDSPSPPPTPGHHPHKPSGWGPGPWGPDPWSPDAPKPDHPDPKPVHPTPPDNFKPVLTLMSAKYDSVGRQIKVDYKILPNGSIPPSKSFSIEYNVLYRGSKVSDVPEDEPLTAAEMTGLQQESLMDVTGAPTGVKASDLSVSAQIHFRENGTVNTGVIGIPVTINVM